MFVVLRNGTFFLFEKTCIAQSFAAKCQTTQADKEHYSIMRDLLSAWANQPQPRNGNGYIT